MKLKKHQKKSFIKELQRGVIIFTVLLLIFALHLVPIPQSGINVLLTIIVFMIFTAPIFLYANATFIKALKVKTEQSLQQAIIIFVAMFVLAQGYALATEQLAGTQFFIAALWFILSVALLIYMNKTAGTAIDITFVMLLWLPLQLSLFAEIDIPAVNSVAGLFSLLGLYILIFTFYVIREYPIGFSFKLNGDDLRIVVLNYILFFFVMIIIGMLTKLLSIADRIPSWEIIFSNIFFIFFFTAIPQEILFRGVIYRIAINQMKGQPYAVGKALLISALLFGFSRGNTAIGPIINVNLGAIGQWYAPWAYMLLMMIAGLFYGLVYIRTKKITAAAAIHLLVEWTLLVFFNAG